MTEQFKATAEYRHWMARHDLEAYPSVMLEELQLIVKQVLGSGEQAYWDRVCSAYTKREFPKWFIKEVGELHDY